LKRLKNKRSLRKVRFQENHANGATAFLLLMKDSNAANIVIVSSAESALKKDAIAQK
jgi:hypothetical protein